MSVTTRRVFLALTGTAAAALVPHSWVKPVVETVIVPAHAQSSPINTTTEAPTTTPTTTEAPTTTPTTTEAVTQTTAET